MECIDCDLSSFGSTENKAIANLKKALEKHREDLPEFATIPKINEITLGEPAIA